MKFPWLKDALEQEGPFLSLYIDTTRTNENAATEITNRWQHLREKVAKEGAPKSLLDSIEDSILRPSSIGGDHGRAIIASGDEILIDACCPLRPAKTPAPTVTLLCCCRCCS